MTVLPSNQKVEVTHTAVFTVDVTGVGKEKFTYQWHKDGIENIISTGDILNLTSVKVTDSGNFTCIVTNEYGDSASGITYLHVTSKHYFIMIHFMCVVS